MTECCADFIGNKIRIDDFAYKKRHACGIIIVDEKTHNFITLLDGRYGDSLWKWLKNEKHIKVITRERASAYKLKMIKRTMYGKCNRELLEVKLCYMRQKKNG